jgi:hypothetical protein
MEIERDFCLASPQVATNDVVQQFKIHLISTDYQFDNNN